MGCRRRLESGIRDHSPGQKQAEGDRARTLEAVAGRSSCCGYCNDRASRAFRDKVVDRWTGQSRDLLRVDSCRPWRFAQRACKDLPYSVYIPARIILDR